MDLQNGAMMLDQKNGQHLSKAQKQKEDYLKTLELGEQLELEMIKAETKIIEEAMKNME